MAVTTLGGRFQGLLEPQAEGQLTTLCPQVCERPLMFLLDTPGVLAPRIPSVETGLKLALCGEPDPHPHSRLLGSQAGRLVLGLAAHG